MADAQPGTKAAARVLGTMLLLLAAGGCAPRFAQCLLPRQQPMTVIELFFGRNIDGRAPLTDAEWSAFTDSVIATEFPDGFTVLDGDGEWRNVETHSLVRERARILLVATSKNNQLAEKIDRVSEAYRRAYTQASVGVLTYEACGAFGN